MRVLIACEFSGISRRAWQALGHETWSCDLLPAEDDESEYHLRGDVSQYLDCDWDLMIAHPPCQYLCNSGARWWKEPGRLELQKQALEFVQLLMDAPIPKIAVENPPGKIGSAIRKADQYVQPWQFGDGYLKKTGLWLKGLPKLVPDNVVEGREAECHKASPGPDRWKLRSRTYPGFARAMAEQWSETPLSPGE